MNFEERAERMLEMIREIPLPGYANQTDESYRQQWFAAVVKEFEDLHSTLLTEVGAESKNDLECVTVRRWLTEGEIELLQSVAGSAEHIATTVGMQLHSALRRIALDRMRAGPVEAPKRRRGRPKKKK